MKKVLVIMSVLLVVLTVIYGAWRYTVETRREVTVINGYVFTEDYYVEGLCTVKYRGVMKNLYTHEIIDTYDNTELAKLFGLVGKAMTEVNVATPLGA